MLYALKIAFPVSLLRLSYSTLSLRVMKPSSQSTPKNLKILKSFNIFFDHLHQTVLTKSPLSYWLKDVWLLFNTDKTAEAIWLYALKIAFQVSLLRLSYSTLSLLVMKPSSQSTPKNLIILKSFNIFFDHLHQTVLTNRKSWGAGIFKEC